MVTGRMSAQKKDAGNQVLKRFGLNASQAINLMYERLVREKNPRFLGKDVPQGPEAWQSAARFIDELATAQPSKFDSMSRAEIKTHRLHNRGVI